MNNPDFYPTPTALMAKMLDGVDLKAAGYILEPSAGKGDLADYVKNRLRSNYDSRPLDLDVIEIEPDLQHILRGKGYTVVHNDFLTFKTVKQYGLIVANFPFSDGDKHLQKALSLLEHGGGLVCLVNAETLRNPHTNLRKAIAAKIEASQGTVEFLTEQFTEAERKTSVEVALIRVHIDANDTNSVLLDNLQKAQTVEDVQTDQSQVVEADFVKALVKRFNTEARMGVTLITEYKALAPLMLERMPKKGEETPYNSCILTLTVGRDKYGTGNLVNDYLKELRYKYWHVLIGDSRFTSRYTSNVTQELSKKLDSLRDYDFTEFNITQLQQELNASLITGIEQAILKLFDELSGKFSYHDDFGDNIHYYNGWKSNKAHKINNKVIIPMNGFSSYSWNAKDKMETYGYAVERLTDMVKALNYLAGELENGSKTVAYAIERANDVGVFRHINFHYFTATFYKKGTCHITFTDEKLLAKFNIFGGRQRGWLPPSYGRKRYSDMTSEEQDVVDSFQGQSAYNEVMGDTDYYIVDTNKLLLT